MIFLGTENYKGISRKIIILLFYRVFQFFTLAQVGTGQIYYFREFINLPSINLKSFYCTIQHLKFVFFIPHCSFHNLNSPLLLSSFTLFSSILVLTFSNTNISNFSSNNLISLFFSSISPFNDDFLAIRVSSTTSKSDLINVSQSSDTSSEIVILFRLLRFRQSSGPKKHLNLGRGSIVKRMNEIERVMKKNEKMRNEREWWNMKIVMRERDTMRRRLWFWNLVTLIVILNEWGNEYEVVFFFLIKGKLYKFSKTNWI